MNRPPRKKTMLTLTNGQQVDFAQMICKAPHLEALAIVDNAMKQAPKIGRRRKRILQRLIDKRYAELLREAEDRAVLERFRGRAR